MTGNYDHMQPVYRRAYWQESALIKAALDATRVSVDDEVVRYGDHIEGLVEAWGAATLEERHQLLSMMLDAVFVDMAQGLVLDLKPKPEFLPLFNLGEPVTTGDAVGGWSRVELHLKHGLAVLAADLANARDKQQMGLDFRQSYSLGVSRRDKTCPIQWPHTRLTGDGQRFVQRTA